MFFIFLPQNSVGSDIAHYLLGRHDDTATIDKETHRLAVVNMDWDHIKVCADAVIFELENGRSELPCLNKNVLCSNAILFLHAPKNQLVLSTALLERELEANLYKSHMPSKTGISTIKSTLDVDV